MIDKTVALRESFETYLCEEDCPPLSKVEKVTIDCFIDYLHAKGYLNTPQTEDTE